MSEAAKKLPFEIQKTTHAVGAPKTMQQVMVFLALATGGALLAGTQFVADRFAYHPNLGPPLYPAGSVPGVVGLLLAALSLGAAGLAYANKPTRRLSLLGVVVAGVGVAMWRGPLYSPLGIVEWSAAYKHVPEALAIVQSGYEVVIYGFGLMMATVILAGSGRKVKAVSTAHGSATLERGDGYAVDPAEFADVVARVDAAREKAAAEKNPDYHWNRTCSSERFGHETPIRYTPGVLIGRHDDGRLLRYTGDSHILTMAPTRSGKGVGAVVPALLTWPGSCVVTDPKGENFEITHQQRLRMGQKVFALDPFRITGAHSFHASFNLLERVDTSGLRKLYARDDADNLAKMMIVDKGAGGEGQHWILEAQSLITGLLLHIKIEGMAGGPDDGNKGDLIELRRLLTLPPEDFADLFEGMVRSPLPMVRRSAARLLQKDDKERSGVISTAQAHTAFLDSDMMSNVVGASEQGVAVVPLDDLKFGKTPITIYLILPPEYLSSHAAWLRLMVTACIDALTRTTGKPPIDVLFLLDEFANLGRMEPVKKGVSLVGGYGAKFWLLVQDLSQLKGVYEKDYDTIFANCDIKQTYGTNDYTTAKLLSDMMGDTTVLTEASNESKGRSYGKSDGSSGNWGESVSEKGRKLLMPEEVMKLPKTKQLLFVKGEQGAEAMVTDKLTYYRDPEFAHQFGSTQMQRRG